jgi:hypothetical protein
MPGPHDGSRATTVRVYLRHHTKPDFNPQPATCSDDAEKGRTGCGASLIFYRTYPGEKRMPFDGEPRIKEGTEVNMGDGGIVAAVYSDNVHFATCPHYKGRRPAASAHDPKAAAAGDTRP